MLVELFRPGGTVQPGWQIWAPALQTASAARRAVVQTRSLVLSMSLSFRGRPRLTPLGRKPSLAPHASHPTGGRSESCLPAPARRAEQAQAQQDAGAGGGDDQRQPGGAD